jgi:hypothetical protein
VSATTGHYHKIYVASSWRNDIYPTVVETLRAHGHSVYDFRRPNGRTRGFNFRNFDRVAADQSTGDLAAADYIDALDHPAAVTTFDSHFDAMLEADTLVLVLPCGRSAHTELGWAVGAGKRTALLLDDPVTPELMYRLVDRLVTTLDDLIAWLAEPEPARAFEPSDIFTSALNRLRQQRNGARR